MFACILRSHVPRMSHASKYCEPSYMFHVMKYMAMRAYHDGVTLAPYTIMIMITCCTTMDG